MKKSLLALAVLGAFAGAAQAQTGVTVYGSFDGGLRSLSNADGAGKHIGSHQGRRICISKGRIRIAIGFRLCVACGRYCFRRNGEVVAIKRNNIITTQRQ